MIASNEGHLDVVKMLCATKMNKSVQYLVY